MYRTLQEFKMDMKWAQPKEKSYTPTTKLLKLLEKSKKFEEESEPSDNYFRKNEPRFPGKFVSFKYYKAENTDFTLLIGIATLQSIQTIWCTFNDGTSQYFLSMKNSYITLSTISRGIGIQVSVPEKDQLLFEPIIQIINSIK